MQHFRIRNDLKCMSASQFTCEIWIDWTDESDLPCSS